MNHCVFAFTRIYLATISINAITYNTTFHSTS